ncbi:hypothetical protein O3P69_008831 [Scylla paramamosain]|uniref:Uncharacterized protein n=1 Tax=Scylla paramamosain TaxID=85552 RepID=A0AAW0TP96_SCYPA
MKMFPARRPFLPEPGAWAVIGRGRDVGLARYKLLQAPIGHSASDDKIQYDYVHLLSEMGNNSVKLAETVAAAVA